MEINEVQLFLEFTEKVNNFYKNSTQSPINASAIIFNDYSIKFHQGIDPLCAGHNLQERNTGHYIAAIEIQYFGIEKFNVFLRFNNWAVYYDDGNYGYCNHLINLDSVHMYEFSEIIDEEKFSLSDWDESTLFQFRLIEQKADDIFVIYKLLKEIINNDNYKPLLTSALRPY